MKPFPTLPTARSLRIACLAALLYVSTLNAATQPHRVVTLAPHLAELVCAAAGCEQLVAVTAYSDFPKQLEKLPQLGDVHRLNMEALIALKPSHVLVWKSGNPQAQQQQLQRLGLPVTFIDMERIDEVPAALERIASLLGTPQRGRVAAVEYRARLKALIAKQQRLKGPRLSVLYQIQTAPVYSINGKSPISDVIKLCGGLNVFAALPTLAAPVSDEAVLAAAPEVVIHAPSDRAEMRAYWQRLIPKPELRPKLLALDPDLLARAGPRMVEGAEQLCAALEQLSHLHKKSK